MRIEITGMTYGAGAVGRADDGKVMFVAGGAPGDMVEVEITRETKGFREGTITEFYEKGSTRVEAPCPFAAVCGGCPWMHLSYESQLQAKRASVVSQLSKIGGIPKDRAEELVGECVGSKRQLGYRNKLELAGGRDERGLFMLGFHERGGKLAAAPKTCLLAAKGIEKAPGALRGALSYLQGRDDLGIFRVGVRRSVRTKDTEIALWTNPSAFPRKAAADTLSSALKCTSIVRVIADPGKARKIKKSRSTVRKGALERRAGRKHLPHQRPKLLPGEHRPSGKDDPAGARRFGGRSFFGGCRPVLRCRHIHVAACTTRRLCVRRRICGFFRTRPSPQHGRNRWRNRGYRRR